jgi:uncharacterized protein (TIGR00251 family)
MAVRVTPRASRDAIESVDDAGALRVRVTAAPADGAANTAVTRLVAKAAGLPRSAVSVASGATSRHKRLRLEGVALADVSARWPGVDARAG